MVVIGKGGHPLGPYDNALPVRPAPVQGVIRPPLPGWASVASASRDSQGANVVRWGPTGPQPFSWSTAASPSWSTVGPTEISTGI